MTTIINGTSNAITFPDGTIQNTAADITPAGIIIFYAANSAPTGYIKANGAAISRSTYSALFSAIGTTFGVGDGSTTFNVPDLRGEFPRGWDDGRGVDSGRAFGSAQLDQMQRIEGAFTGNRLTVGANNDIANRAGAFANNTINSTVATQVGLSAGVATQDVSQRYGFDSSQSPDARTSSTTSGETRSRNVALLACIKF